MFVGGIFLAKPGNHLVESITVRTGWRISVSQGGMYLLQLMDQYAATYTILAIGLSMTIGLAWVYG